jgi:beta-N-acetylhexosaminidase
MVRLFSLCLAGALLVWGCAGKSPLPREEAAESADADTGEKAGEDPVLPAYREQAARIVSSLDEYYLTSQVLMAGLDNKTGLSGDMKTLLKDHPPGGIMFFRYNLNTEKDQVRSFLEDCSSLVAASVEPRGINPFLAVDHEGGLVHRFGPGVEKLPAAASFWETARGEGWETALEAVETGARRSGGELRSLGITMNFAPVAEILTGDNRLFLETRSYGPDGAFVEAAAAAFIRGMDAAGIACVVKHFPGNSGADPHRGPAVLAVEGETLEQMVRPFAFLIENFQVPAFMISHVVIPAWDGERNASLSPEIIQGQLREAMGFTGIVLADDYSMGAVARSGLDTEDAVVAALNAGVDMVMVWPSNIRSVHDAILAALGDGRLAEERLREAAERILAEKIRYGLIGEGDSHGNGSGRIH